MCKCLKIEGKMQKKFLTNPYQDELKPSFIM